MEVVKSEEAVEPLPSLMRKRKKKTPKAQHVGWCSAAVFEAADVARQHNEEMYKKVMATVYK